jgi:hypothetical protein
MPWWAWLALSVWPLALAGHAAHAEPGSKGGGEALPSSPAFRKVLSALFPEYQAPKQAIMGPSKPGLPKVGIVVGLEKPWRKFPGQVIVALQVVRFEKGYSDVKSCPDIAVAVVRIGGKDPEIVARSAFLPGLPGETGAPVESFQDCRKLTEIDTADFRIGDRDTAFGVRLRRDDVTKTGARYRESLVLFRVSGPSLRPILSTDSESCDCATSGYHGCGKLQGAAAKCEPADGSDYRKVYLKILPGKTKGMNEIARLEERVPGEKSAEAGVFRWNGEQYQLVPAAPSAP